jgi:hypothetical protein
VSKKVSQLYPDLEFVFNTNVPTIPVVYVTDEELTADQATNPATRKRIIGSKGSPLGTSHKIRVTLPKRDADYYFLVFISYIDPETKKKRYITLWHDSISVTALPRTM